MAEIYRSVENDQISWERVECGHVSLVKDYNLKKFMFRLYNCFQPSLNVILTLLINRCFKNHFFFKIKQEQVLWEDEMYTPFELKKLNDNFYFYPTSVRRFNLFGSNKINSYSLL